MLRLLRSLLPALAVLLLATTVRAQSGEPPPLTYELIINGEAFLIQANRVHRLQSQEKPGVSYEVAVRVAANQQLKLNTVQLLYDRHFKVADDHGREKRTTRLSHQLGFSMLITDLGAPLKPQQQEEALKLVTESVTKTFRELKVADLDVGEPHTRKFGEATGRGLVVQYRDEQDFGHTCLVYVLTGPEFAATCIAQYLTDDAEDALPLIKRTLDSIRAVK